MCAGVSNVEAVRLRGVATQLSSTADGSGLSMDCRRQARPVGSICQYRNWEGRAVATGRRTQAVSWFVSTRAGASHGETVQCHDGELSPTCSFETRDQTRSPALTIEHWQEQRDRLVAAQPPCELVVRRHVPLSQWSWVEQETVQKLQRLRKRSSPGIQYAAVRAYTSTVARRLTEGCAK